MRFFNEENAGDNFRDDVTIFAARTSDAPPSVNQWNRVRNAKCYSADQQLFVNQSVLCSNFDKRREFVVGCDQNKVEMNANLLEIRKFFQTTHKKIMRAVFPSDFCCVPLIHTRGRVDSSASNFPSCQMDIPIRNLCLSEIETHRLASIR